MSSRTPTAPRTHAPAVPRSALDTFVEQLIGACYERTLDPTTNVLNSMRATVELSDALSPEEQRIIGEALDKVRRLHGPPSKALSDSNDVRTKLVSQLTERERSMLQNTLQNHSAMEERLSPAEQHVNAQLDRMVIAPVAVRNALKYGATERKATITEHIQSLLRNLPTTVSKRVVKALHAIWNLLSALLSSVWWVVVKAFQGVEFALDVAVDMVPAPSMMKTPLKKVLRGVVKLIEVLAYVLILYCINGVVARTTGVDVFAGLLSLAKISFDNYVLPLIKEIPGVQWFQNTLASILSTFEHARVLLARVHDLEAQLAQLQSELAQLLVVLNKVLHSMINKTAGLLTSMGQPLLKLAKDAMDRAGLMLDGGARPALAGISAAQAVQIGIAVQAYALNHRKPFGVST